MGPLREHWSLDPDLTFLNHGSFGACPRPVLDAQAEWRARLERNPVDFFTRRFRTELDRAREEVARFVGARFEDLAFVQNSTTGVSAVLGSHRFEPGDAVLTTDHAYHACRNALDHLASRAAVEVVVVPIPLPLQDAGDVVDRIVGGLERVSARPGGAPRVRLALVDHVTSPTGLVFPIAEIARQLRERGVETLVDGAHGPGMVPLGLEELGAAYYVGNLHKWACAPKGAALLWARRDRQAELHPTVTSHGYDHPRREARFQEEFAWIGTTDPSAYLTVPEALRFVGGLLPGGWDEVRERNRALAVGARRLLERTLGVPSVAPESMIGSLAAVTVPEAEPGASPAPPDDVLHRALFSRHRIEVPVFPWPAPPRRLLRTSAHLYNEAADYERLAAALGVELGLER